MSARIKNITFLNAELQSGAIFTTIGAEMVANSLETVYFERNKVAYEIRQDGGVATLWKDGQVGHRLITMIQITEYQEQYEVLEGLFSAEHYLSDFASVTP